MEVLHPGLFGHWQSAHIHIPHECQMYTAPLSALIRKWFQGSAAFSNKSPRSLPVTRECAVISTRSDPVSFPCACVLTPPPQSWGASWGGVRISQVWASCFIGLVQIVRKMILFSLCALKWKMLDSTTLSQRRIVDKTLSILASWSRILLWLFVII